MPVVGVAITQTWMFVGLDNALVTGKVDGDFTASAYLMSGPATTAAVTVAAVGGQSGDYGATFTPSAVGRWKLNASCVNNGFTHRWEWEFDVVTARQADPAAALVSQNLTVDAPLATEADKAVVAGDAATLAWSSTGWPDLTGETATFQAYKTLTDTAVFASAKSVTISNSGAATQNLSLALLGTDTDDFTAGIAYRYEVNSTAGTLASGTLSAREG